MICWPPYGPLRAGSVGPIEADDRRAESGREMQRAGIRGDHKFRAAHKSHQRTETEWESTAAAEFLPR